MYLNSLSLGGKMYDIDKYKKNERPYKTMEDIEKIVECGADECLPKPIKLKDFQKNVHRLLK